MIIMDGTMGTKIEEILDKKERLLWRGVINRKALVCLYAVIFGFFCFIGFIVMLPVLSMFFRAGVAGFILGGILFVPFALLILGIIALLFFSAMMREFAITPKRVIIKSGIIGTDFKSIEYNQIKAVAVDVGIIGKIFSVGTIKIDTGKTETYSSGNIRSNNFAIKTRTMYEKFQLIDNPYDVHKQISSFLSRRKESLYSGRRMRY
jgi:uncharacterized membrane protein YdbT with pleckstrin-like domain